MRRLTTALTIASVALLGALAQTASAAPTPTFVAPNGSGTACTQAVPCGIATGFSQLLPGGDLTIGDGTYGSPSSPLTSTLSAGDAYASIHGPSAGDRPVVYLSASIGISLQADGMSLADLDVRDAASGDAIRLGYTSHATRVRAQDTGDGDGCELNQGSSISDSICIGNGPGGAGLDNSALISGGFVSATNVLAIGTGNAYGASVDGGAARDVQLALVNSIAQGGGGSPDLEATNTSTGLTRLIVRDSQWVTKQQGTGTFIVDSGGNVGTAPSFKPATDFEPATTSPTFDVGNDSSADQLAYTGDPRRMGAHVDIGPYERLVRPTATHPSADAITDTSVALHGTADTQLVGGTWQFLYGTTTSYGSSTAGQTLAPGEPAHDVTAAISGLQPGTTYHAKLIVQGRGGGGESSDIAFTTSPAPPPVTITTTTPGPTITTPGPTVTLPASGRGPTAAGPQTGPPTCTVPAVKVGSTLAAAKVALEGAHCKVGRTTTVHSSTKRGRVVKLSSKKGTSTTAAVGIVVSSGPGKQ
ncbi:MAG TPA: hypothetical protein VGC32_03305 [Solirubrobacterales bacterium]